MYKITNPSILCPTKRRTIKHPKIIEDEMKAYLATFRANTNTPAEITLLTKSGQQLPVDLETSDFSQMSGILSITDIDNTVMGRICAAQPQLMKLSFFFIFHLLLRASHDDEATIKLESEVQGLYWMSGRPEFDFPLCEGLHYDIIHDDDRRKLYFGYPEYIRSCSTFSNDVAALRLSLFGISPDLSEYAPYP